MSYFASRFLTLGVLPAVFAVSLFAQRAEIKRELPELSSPVAWERAAAVARIAAIEGDISADLRVAYGIADVHERIGLIEAAQMRTDEALLSQAALELSNQDERLSGTAHEYLMNLQFETLNPDLGEMNEAQTRAWENFLSFRIRRDISINLLDAHLMPGKYFGQFETLRRVDSRRVDAELILLIRGDAAYAKALNLASAETVDAEGPPARTFKAAFRRLSAAAGGFEPALEYLRTMTMTDELTREVRRTPRSRFQAALEVFGNIRAAAVRALAGSPNADELKQELGECYAILERQTPDPVLVHVVNLEATQIEIEVTLARLGNSTLLDARIAALRTQIERVEQAQANVNMNANARPDLIAQNEIAHLHLRSGNLKDAEEEWKDAANGAIIMMRSAEGRNRSSLSSYLAAVYYNLACAQSLQLNASSALASLKKAVEHGYKDFPWMLEDGDLYEVRQQKDFRAWFKYVAPPSVADDMRTDR